MKAPKYLDFTPEQIEELVDRLNKEALRKEDYPILTNLLKAIVWMNFSLQEKKLSIQRLRAIFGIKTESAKRLVKLIENQEAVSASEQDANASKSTDTSGQDGQQPSSSSNASIDESSSNRKKGHGHRPASDYTQAKAIHIAHETLKKGSSCPSCLKGKLFNLSAGSVIRIVGQPWLQVEIYRPERLRCAVCGKIFTATLPREVITGSRADSSAKAIVSLLKYRGGIPFYRQGHIQEILGAPISPSEIWEMTEDVADAVQPAYAAMCEHAAAAELIQNDDTKARVLSIMKDRQECKGTDEEDKRTGIFTTGLLATLQNLGVKVALFFTGVNHAGENLDAFLNKRPQGLPVPIQQCDGGHNVSENHATHLSNCNAHCRRYFYELVEAWPKIVIKIIGWYSSVFANDRSAPSDPQSRLKWHQERSGPIMKQLKNYCDSLIEQKEVEPNSSMGKAIAYLQNHWEALTLFLRMPGVPIHNNDNEQILKRAVLNRKNAYFYRNETGAKIGDVLMSVIETCVLNGANPWEYLVAVQKYQKDVRSNPSLWVPWLYENRLKELQSAALQEVHQQ
jgi:transposase